MSHNNAYHTNISVSEFDEIAHDDGFAPFTKIMKYTINNGAMEVDIINYGATITAIRVPDKDGNLDDVVLGFDNMGGYMAAKNNNYFGATIGRVANRIANGKFLLDKQTYFLSKNEGDKTLHGGIVGFNRKIWDACIDAESLVFSLVSPHLDQGFPGEVKVKARFILTQNNEFVIRYTATCDRPTIINLTSHSYFNLAGHGSGAEKLYEHNLMINAINFTPNDDDGIPKGKIQDVLDTVLDFSTKKNLGESILETGDANGFDVNLVIDDLSEWHLMACLEHPGTGRRLEISSNQPGVQFYTGNCIELKEGEGKEGVAYSRHAAVSLETQNYPNAINEKRFPTCILRPPAMYSHVISYKFSIYDPDLQSQARRSEQNSIMKSVEDFEANTEPPPPPPPDETDAVNSIKSEGAETTEKPEPLECMMPAVYPDFRTGLSSCKDFWEQYEPLSSIEMSELQTSMRSSFDSELKMCRQLLHTPLPLPNYGKSRSTVYSVVAQTDITFSRHDLEKESMLLL